MILASDFLSIDRNAVRLSSMSSTAEKAHQCNIEHFSRFFHFHQRKHFFLRARQDPDDSIL
jgi:hypothetical protein